MITYEDYSAALIINKSKIPESDFPAYAAEAERLINSTVTQPIPEDFESCVKDVAAKLCHQMYLDAQSKTLTGPIITSKSEKSRDYSYSESYDNSNTGHNAYMKIIKDGLMFCNGNFTGLFFTGICNARDRRCCP